MKPLIGYAERCAMSNRALLPQALTPIARAKKESSIYGIGMNWVKRSDLLAPHLPRHMAVKKMEILKVIIFQAFYTLRPIV